MKTPLLAIAAAGTLAGAVWLGRASSSPSAAPTVAAAPASPPVAAPSRASAPTLPPPRRAPAVAGRAIATPGLAADLADPDPRVRQAALKEAAHELDPAALVTAVRDPSLDVRVTAALAMGDRYQRGELDARDLISVATDRALDERTRSAALNGLGLVPSTEGADVLVDLLANGSPSERGSAAILLVHQDPAVAMPALIRALGDSDELVRANAAEALRARARGRDFGTDAAAWSAWWSSRAR